MPHSINEITKEDQRIIDAFFLLKEKEEYQKAFSLLNPLAKKYANNYTISFLLGMVLYLQHEYKKAKKYLKKTVLLSPHHKLASLTLFHSLSELSEWHTGFQELRRFLLTESDEKDDHLQLLQELVEGTETFSTSQKDSIKRLSKEFLF